MMLNPFHFHFVIIDIDILIRIAQMQHAVSNRSIQINSRFEDEVNHSGLDFVYTLEFRLIRPSHKTMQNRIDQQQLLFQAHRRNMSIPQAILQIIGIQSARPVLLNIGILAKLTARRLDPRQSQRPQPVQMSDQNELSLMSGLPIGILEKFPQNGCWSIDDILDALFIVAIALFTAEQFRKQNRLTVFVFECRELDLTIVVNSVFREIYSLTFENGLCNKRIEQVVDDFPVFVEEALILRILRGFE